MTDPRVTFALEKHEVFIISTALTVLSAQVKEKGIKLAEYEPAMIARLIETFNEALI